MSTKYLVESVIVAGILVLVVGMAVWRSRTTAYADDAERTNPSPAAVTATAGADGSPANITAAEDGQRGGRLMFSTRGKDGALTEKMRLTKDGALAVGTRIPPGYPRAGKYGGLNVIIDDPSRPGAILMNNMHEAARGVGNTLCWGASTSPESDGWQIFMSSSWPGDVRRVKQEYNRPLPAGYPSTDYPGPASQARMEIGMRVHDWVSLAAIFEPIADDGRAFVTADREHPYMGQVQYLEPGGEWINSRRIGRHAMLIGTTHTTGATAGGVVLAGDSYHEYQGRGPVIKSPNGTAYRIVVDDKGNLSTEKF